MGNMARLCLEGALTIKKRKISDKRTPNYAKMCAKVL